MSKLDQIESSDLASVIAAAWIFVVSAGRAIKNGVPIDESEMQRTEDGAKCAAAAICRQISPAEDSST